MAFRNLLIHGYAAVVDEIVWQVVEDDLPALRASAARLIEELTPGT
ncbi:MAG TPA: HepT-like ribonuclease domain-containing protein [Thermoanaerobaculia bacterium]|nr:HepT-like ribonuclease domain-containing protein [Thermoanaerobaculia bacterium]